MWNINEAIRNLFSVFRRYLYQGRVLMLLNYLC